MTSVEGQYMAGGLTSKFCNIPNGKSATDIKSFLLTSEAKPYALSCQKE